MFKVDLHTHSVASPDGSLTLDDYREMLEHGGLDFIAITDHGSLEFARRARKELGKRIIIGEEIKAKEGELIGLFLRERVPPGLTAKRSAERIRKQGGLVYIPHPFERVRQGLKVADLDVVADLADVVEIYNGRALSRQSGRQAKQWAEAHLVAGAASSDAHGRRGWGRTYSVIDTEPTAKSLPNSLRRAKFVERFVGVKGVFYPKLNRVRKRGGQHGV